MRPNSLSYRPFSPFVVVGSSKSGTTWLQKILDLHPQIRCHFHIPIFPLNRKELFYPASVVFKCGNSPYNGLFDQRQEEQYHATLNYINGINVLEREFFESRTRGMTREGAHQTQRLHRRTVRSIVEALLCGETDKHIVGTKAYTDLDNLFDIFPDAKVIHIIRDGRDVCVSKRFHTLRKGIYYFGDEKNIVFRFINHWDLSLRVVKFLRRRFNWFGKNWFMQAGAESPLFTQTCLTKFAEDWRRVVTYILKRNRQHPDQFLTVYYEQLKNDGHQQIKKILTFLSARSDAKTVETLIEKTRFDRLKKENLNLNSFFRKGVIGDWKNHFKKDDIKLFDKIAGELLVDLKYEKKRD